MKQQRLTFRLGAGEMQTLQEMRDRLGVSCSCIVRTIILDFLTRNEEILEEIMYPELQQLKNKNNLTEEDILRELRGFEEEENKGELCR